MGRPQPTKPTLTHWSLWVAHNTELMLNMQSSSIFTYIYLLVTEQAKLVRMPHNHPVSMWVRLWDVGWAGGVPKVSPTHAYSEQVCWGSERETCRWILLLLLPPSLSLQNPNGVMCLTDLSTAMRACLQLALPFPPVFGYCLSFYHLSHCISLI